MLKELFALSRYQLLNVLRAKWLIAYGVFFFVLTSGFLFFGSDVNKAVASVLSVVLFIVPMISILYATIYWYNSAPFTYLLLSQPLRRSSVFLSNWISISCGISASFSISAALALLLHQALGASSLTVLVFGVVLTFIFVGLGLLTSVWVADPVKGVGTAFLIWFYFSLLHDVVVFSVVSLFKEYPVEVPAIILMAVNPIDLTRVHSLLILDLSAMMGYTGRILQELLSTFQGRFLTALVQLLWVVVPVWIGTKAFGSRDLSS